MTMVTDSSGAVVYNQQIAFSDQTQYGQVSTKLQAQQWAENLFQQAIKKGQWTKVVSFFRRRANQLWQLHPAQPTEQVRAAQREQVRLEQIVGSTNGRIHDFDNNFLPLQSHNKARWVGVATAVRLGKQLPPIELVQVDNVYFVVDGHHRLSVAQAMGQTEIEAHVTIHQIVTPA